MAVIGSTHRHIFWRKLFQKCEKIFYGNRLSHLTTRQSHEFKWNIINSKKFPSIQVDFDIKWTSENTIWHRSQSLKKVALVCFEWKKSYINVYMWTFFCKFQKRIQLNFWIRCNHPIVFHLASMLTQSKSLWSANGFIVFVLLIFRDDLNLLCTMCNFHCSPWKS